MSFKVNTFMIILIVLLSLSLSYDIKLFSEKPNKNFILYTNNYKYITNIKLDSSDREYYVLLDTFITESFLFETENIGERIGVIKNKTISKYKSYKTI